MYYHHYYYYITDADKEVWERERGGSLFYTSVTGHSMGHIILVRKHFPFDVQRVFKNDRIITVPVMLINNEMCVTNVYARTISIEKGIFLHNLYEHINTLNSVDQTVCVDFNCVLDNERDVVSGDQHDTRDVNKFNDLVSKF